MAPGVRLVESHWTSVQQPWVLSHKVNGHRFDSPLKLEKTQELMVPVTCQTQ